MKAIVSIVIACFALPILAQAAPARHESLRQEIRLAISRGNQWLQSRQQADGQWGDGQLPAITALALNAAVRDPAFDRNAPFPDPVEKGFQWLLRQQKEDGGIYNRGLTVYNTAASVTALTATGRSDFEPAIVRARKHLIDNHWDLGKDKETDHPNDGGIGYGSNKEHADLSNTVLAIEALALSKKIIDDGRHGDQPDLDWNAAITFLSRCQNLKATNDQEWASDDPKNKGGFAYSPHESKAGEEKTPEGRTALRSYGSMSYAGLLSLIYAKVGPDDPRVKAVKEWLGRNYTLDENPGMGAQGLYYYYQAMAKALGVSTFGDFAIEGGREVDWRSELGNKLLTLQREDGSWVNDNGRWMESDPVLITSYTILALAQIHDSIR